MVQEKVLGPGPCDTANTVVSSLNMKTSWSGPLSRPCRQSRPCKPVEIHAILDRHQTVQNIKSFA
jgi:hypothetical protein